MQRKTDHKMKGLTVAALGSMALTIVVAAIIISMGTTILTDMEENNCPYTYGAVNGSSTVTADPVSETYSGCCQTFGTGNSNCTLWYSSAAYNATHQGISGMITFADWIPMIALVVVAAIVIGVIVTYLGKVGGSA